MDESPLSDDDCVDAVRDLVLAEVIKEDPDQPGLTQTYGDMAFRVIENTEQLDDPSQSQEFLMFVGALELISAYFKGRKSKPNTKPARRSQCNGGERR